MHGWFAGIFTATNTCSGCTGRRQSSAWLSSTGSMPASRLFSPTMMELQGYGGGLGSALQTPAREAWSDFDQQSKVAHPGEVMDLNQTSPPSTTPPLDTGLSIPTLRQSQGIGAGGRGTSPGEPNHFAGINSITTAASAARACVPLQGTLGPHRIAQNHRIVGLEGMVFL